MAQFVWPVIPTSGSSAGAIQIDVNGTPTDVNINTTNPAANINLPVSQSGRSIVTTVRNVYSSTNVTTGAWVQLVASLGSAVNAIEIFDSSGQTLELGTGAASSETRLILITPGGNELIPVAIASGTRVSIRAVSATANVGELDINFYS